MRASGPRGAEFFVAERLDDLVPAREGGLRIEPNSGRIRNSVDSVETRHDRSRLHRCVPSEDLDTGVTRDRDIARLIENRFRITPQESAMFDSAIVVVGLAGCDAYVDFGSR